MRRAAALIVVICALCACCCGCRLDCASPEGILDRLDRIASSIGRSQLTCTDDLIGSRSCADSYTGQYSADCSSAFGCDVVFGGASVKERTLKISGYVRADSGSASVRVRQNWEVTELTPDAEGRFEAVFALSGGGNYIMVDYDQFSGAVELNVEYNSSPQEQE